MVNAQLGTICETYAFVKRTTESETVYIGGARSDRKFDKERQQRKNSKGGNDTMRNTPLNEMDDDDCGFLERRRQSIVGQVIGKAGLSTWTMHTTMQDSIRNNEENDDNRRNGR